MIWSIAIPCAWNSYLGLGLGVSTLKTSIKIFSDIYKLDGKKQNIFSIKIVNVQQIMFTIRKTANDVMN